MKHIIPKDSFIGHKLFLTRKILNDCYVALLTSFALDLVGEQVVKLTAVYSVYS